MIPGNEPGARVVSDEQDDSDARVERRHAGGLGSARAANHRAARIDLVHDHVAEILDPVVLLDHDLGRAARVRAFDRGVRVGREQAPVAGVVLALGHDVGPAHEPRHALHVDAQEDLHSSPAMAFDSRAAWPYTPRAISESSDLRRSV